MTVLEALAILEAAVLELPHSEIFTNLIFVKGMSNVFVLEQLLSIMRR
jgi:hypothetical protein